MQSMQVPRDVCMWILSLHICACARALVRVRMRVCVRVRVCARVRVRMYVCVRACVCVPACARARVHE